MNQNTSSPVATTVETSNAVAQKPAPKAKLLALAHEIFGRTITDVIVPALKEARQGVLAGDTARPIQYFLSEKQVGRVLAVFPLECNAEQLAAVATFESLSNEDSEKRPGFAAIVKALQMAMGLAQSRQRPLLETAMATLGMSFRKEDRNEDLARRVGERRNDLVWKFIPNLHSRIVAFRSTITSKRVELSPLPDVSNVHELGLEDLQKVFKMLSDMYGPVAASERRQQQPAQPQRAPQPPKAKAPLRATIGDLVSKHCG